MKQAKKTSASKRLLIWSALNSDLKAIFETTCCSMDFDVLRQRVITHVKGLIISTLQFLLKNRSTVFSLSCQNIKKEHFKVKQTIGYLLIEK